MTVTTSVSTRNRQGGAILVFGLIVLLVLTILGVSALRNTTIQQLMSGNLQERTRAFTASESGIDGVLASLEAFTSITAPTTFIYDYTDTANEPHETVRSRSLVYVPIQGQRVKNTEFPSSTPDGGATSYALHDQVGVGLSGATLAPTAQDVKQQGIRQNIPNLDGGGEAADFGGVKAPSES